MQKSMWSWAAGAFCLLLAQAAAAQGGRVLSEVDCPAAEPMGLAEHDGALWLSDMTTRSILKVQPSDGRLLSKLDASGLMPTGLAWHDGVLHSADRRRDWIARRRPGADSDLSPIDYYERWASGMVHDGTVLWVVDGRADKLHKVDPQDGTTIASFPTPAKNPTGLAFDGEYLWLADHGTDELYQVDRRDGSVLTTLTAPGPYPNALAFHDGALVVADYQSRKLYRVALPGEVPYVEDEERRVKVTFEANYRVTGPGSIKGLTAYLALPRDIPGQHLLGELSFEPEPTRLETDRWGQKIAVFELGDVPSGELRSASWTGDFSLFRVRFHLQPEVVDGGEFPPETQSYLADDRKYDLQSKVVGDLVTKLTNDRVGTYARARAIYQHLTDVITYDRSSGWNNAATVLERGTGSCSEYTFAIVALLRRAGIPARYVGAISERGDEASFDDVFHRWAEAYFPGYGWVPIDANAGQGALPGKRGHFFGGRSNRHVVTTIGGGASQQLEWDYNCFATYQTVGAAEVERRPIARYRPLEGGTKAQPHAALPVQVPDLAGNADAEGTAAAERAAPTVSGLVVVVVVAVVFAGIGFGFGRVRRKVGN